MAKFRQLTDKEAMAYDNLLLEIKDGIARITFNRPNVLNALNRKTMEELGEILNLVRADSAVRVVILTGAGEKAFIAGADITELAQQNLVWWAVTNILWSGKESFTG
jgi:enoyl-CoA hydratase